MDLWTYGWTKAPIGQPFGSGKKLLKRNKHVDLGLPQPQLSLAGLSNGYKTLARKPNRSTIELYWSG